VEGDAAFVVEHGMNNAVCSGRVATAQMLRRESQHGLTGYHETHETGLGY
jgi:hypothetical protein